MVNIRLKLSRDERFLKDLGSIYPLLIIILIAKTSKNEDLQIRFYLNRTGV